VAAFNALVDVGLDYQFIAYLFFIKDSKRFVPISQEKFDFIFEQLGIVDFRTRNNLSWENYNKYCELIKVVRDFLKSKSGSSTLLDAHSFLWILSNQIQKDQLIKEFDSELLKIKKEMHNLEIMVDQTNNSNNDQLPDDITQKSDEIVQKIQGGIDIVANQSNDPYDDEVLYETITYLPEGNRNAVLVNKYERNPKARKLYIDHWKAICSVCNFNFEQFYGEIGRGFIHIHHLNPVSLIEELQDIDPIKDLIPLCPNCHSMVHRANPPLTVLELKRIVEKNKFAREVF